MHNKAFWRALHSLAHPLTIIAVVTLLLNDHLLRLQWPGWWTGKLGDFAWLVFAPLVCGLVVALIPSPPGPLSLRARGRKSRGDSAYRHLPTLQRTRHAVSLQHRDGEQTRLDTHERWVGIVSFAFIGVWFALAKTVPFVHALTTRTLEAIIGWEGTLRLDATDLLTLPALIIGWHIWTRADNTPPTLSPRVWPILALGIMATLASDLPHYSYIGRSATCIFQEGTQLIIYGSTSGHYESKGTVEGKEEWELKTETEVFRSRDGGLLWRSETYENYEKEIPICPQNAHVLVDPNNELIQYRWIPADRIERSSDGGITWTMEYDLVELRQDVRNHYNHNRFDLNSESIVYQPSPFSGIIDPKTGNVMFAMGLDGVLVRTLNAEWVWAQTGPYYLANIERFDQISAILFFEFWLAGALCLLVLTTSAAYIRRAWRFRQLLLGIGWFGWFILTLFLLPLHHLSSEELASLPIAVASLPLLIFLAIPLSIAALFDFMNNYMRFLGYVALAGVGNALLFLFPFVLWTQGTIPPYRTALTFSLLITLGALAASYTYLKRILPRVPIPKKQQLTTNDQQPTTES